MHPLVRFATMYTTINLSAIGIVWGFSIEPMKDILRASTLLILIMVIGSVWMGDTGAIYTRLFDSFAPQSQLSTIVKQGIVCVADVVFHVLPIVLIGISKEPVSYVIAAMILALWLLLFRNKIDDIYVPGIKIMYSMALITVVLIGILLYTF